jgi:HK97 family phage major capsid protein
MPASGITVPEFTEEQLVRMIIEPLAARAVLMAAGPVVLDSSQGVPVRIPEIASFSETDNMFHENEEITPEGEATSGERTLLPSTLKSFKSLARLSSELVRHSPLALLSAWQQQMVQGMARAIDKEMFQGTGTPDVNGNHGMVGILNHPDIQSQDWDTTPADSDAMLDPISDAIGRLISAEFDDTSLGRGVLFIPGAAFTEFDKIKTVDGLPVWEKDVTNPARRRLKGVPVVVTSQLPADTGALVLMDQVVAARDLSPQVKVDVSRYFEFDQVAVRVVSRFDVGLLHPEGVVKLELPA